MLTLNMCEQLYMNKKNIYIYIYCMNRISMNSLRHQIYNMKIHRQRTKNVWCDWLINYISIFHRS